MYCRECGNELQSNAVRCSKCSTQVGYGVNYCHNCGYNTKSSLVDMRLDDKIDEEIYQIKVTEINEKMDGLLLQKQSLKDKMQDQQDINKRLTEFQNIISKHEILQKFDRHVFESIIDRVIVGEKAENGEINPYKLKFIFKTGYEKDEVASSQPFSFANSCSNGNNDCDIISLQGDNDTCRDSGASFEGTSGN